jgi:AcrR family transcriptional regulator
MSQRPVTDSTGPGAEPERSSGAGPKGNSGAPPGGRGRRSDQLPPGRHGLTRERVVEHQRARMLVAVAEVSVRKGYAAMSVEDIIARAGVSRRTFYDQFRNKEEAYLAAYDASVDQLSSRVRSAFERADGPVEQARECLAALLEVIAAEPAFSRMCIVDVLGAGPSAIARRDAAIRDLAALIEEAAKAIPAAHRPPSLTSEAVVGGIHQIIYARLVRGEVDTLPGLLPDLVYTLLLPYVGHRAAEAAHQDARERSAGS